MIKLTEKLPYPVIMEMVRDLISKKWHEQFPEDFIHCNTLLKDVYDSTKGFAYVSYISFLNAMNRSLISNPDYKINDADGFELGIDVQIEAQERLLNDIENCENIKIWCVDNIGAYI